MQKKKYGFQLVYIFSWIGSCFSQPGYLLWCPIWIMPYFYFSIWRCWQKVIFCGAIWQRVNNRFMSFIQGVYDLGISKISKTNPAILWATNNLYTTTQEAVYLIFIVYMACKPEYNNDPLMLQFFPKWFTSIQNFLCKILSMLPLNYFKMILITLFLVQHIYMCVLSKYHPWYS